MASFVKFQTFVEKPAEKVHNLGSDQLKIALTNTAPTVATDDELAAISEINYDNLSSRDVTTDASAQTGGTYKLTLDDLTLTASGSVGPFRYVVLYNDTAAGDPLIAYWDYGSAITLNSGDEFVIDFSDGSGVLTIA